MINYEECKFPINPKNPIILVPDCSKALPIVPEQIASVRLYSLGRS